VRSAFPPPSINVTPLIDVLVGSVVLLIDLAKGAGVITVGLVKDEA